MYKVMLIEDDLQLSELVQNNLERYGYDVYQPDDFMKVEEAFDEIEPHLVLLDITLPYYDGFYVSRRLRQKSNVPIIIISARSQEVDQIMAIELGADDYVTKPFTFELLQSRVKATMRRVYGEYAAAEPVETCIGGLCINSKTFTLTYKKRKVELSKNEYKLLKKLIDHHGAFVAREELIEEVWDSVQFVDDNTLTVNMSRIRQLLSELGIEDGIKSKRGAGYMLFEPAFINHG